MDTRLNSPPRIARGWIAALLLVTALIVTPARGQSDNGAVVLDITGAIGPAISNFIEDGFAEAEGRGARVIILRMDTPGGLDTAMRDIIKNIINSKVPVITYVAPSGARAASAGTYILYASHVAAMAPGTNLGAATPIQIGGGSAPAPGGVAGPKDEDAEEDKPRRHPTLEDKIVNDAVAYIRGLAQLRGRNADWAEKAVAEAASLSAVDALEQGVIDLIAADIPDLLAQADGRTVMVGDEERTLKVAGLPATVIEPDWQTEFLAVITDPSIAYFLFIIGIYGLFLEFSNPGLIAPGIIGAISLLLALFAFQMLPINYVGLALIVLGFALMIAEALSPSIGALGIGGVIALVIGSIMLIDTDVPGFGISPVLIGSVGFASGILFLGLASFAMRAWRRPVATGAEAMIGIEGEILDWSGQRGRVRVHGELWRARGPSGLERGAKVVVTALENLWVTVEPGDGQAPGSGEKDGPGSNEPDEPRSSEQDGKE